MGFVGFGGLRVRWDSRVWEDGLERLRDFEVGWREMYGDSGKED